MSFSSEKAGPRSCKEVGRPFPPGPIGRQTAGNPVRKFYKEKKLAADALSLEEPLQVNEFVIFKGSDSSSSSALGRYDAGEKAIVPLTRCDSLPWGLKPLNIEQRFALELLLRPEISLVSLVGLPGSGKTVLSLAAGLEQTLAHDKIYRRLMVARPVLPVGHDIGFLPGTKQEKL